jgi:hypothetical protein
MAASVSKPTITEKSANRYGYLLCFHRRIAPMTEPRTATPRMNGRAMGITSQARTASPSETTAPARVPGTDTLPQLLGDAGRGLSVGRGVNVTSVMDRLVLSRPHNQWYSYRLCVTRPTGAEARERCVPSGAREVHCRKTRRGLHPAKSG